MLELRINDSRVAPGDLDPATTLLDYLRNTMHLTGTKEGCASGDCGACTVVVGYLQEPARLQIPTSGPDAVVYRTLNSCITPLAALHGTQVLTVEAVGNNTRPHAVQSAMVQQHGSQCGFCTPGFVMSMVGLTLRQSAPDASASRESGASGAVTAESIRPALGGNLCRCTGYRSILDAGVQALSSTAEPIPALEHTAAVLREINTHNVKPGLQTRYFQPTTAAELQGLLAEDADRPARIVVGGTDLWLEVTQQYRRFEKVIDVSRVETLNRTELTHDALTIGAAVTHERLESLFGSDGLVPCAAIIRMLDRFASPQIRHRGSLGGNLANGSPIADWPPVLLALDAQVHIGSVSGRRTRLPIDIFHEGYRKTALDRGQYLQSVEIPLPVEWSALQVFKITKRHEDDISSVLGAFYFKVDNGRICHARIAYGGVAAIPLRVPSVEAMLLGQMPDSFLPGQVSSGVLVEALGEVVKPISDVRASVAYRSAMAATLLQKALAVTAGHTDPDLLAVQPA